MSIVADDCILYWKINFPTDIDILQNDLKELENWKKIWKMKFNIEKCMHGTNSYFKKQLWTTSEYLSSQP